MDLSARFTRDGDEREIIELLETCFEGWPERDLIHSKEEFWRWKFCDNPLGSGLVVLGVYDDRIVSCNHGTFINIKIGNKIVLCSQGSDLCVHPDFRRMGVTHIMRDTRNSVFKEINLAFSYASAENPIVIANRKRRGRDIFPQPIIELVKIDDVPLHLEKMNTSRSWFKLPIFQIVKLVEDTKRKAQGSTRKSVDFTIKRVTKFNETIDTFYDSVNENFNFLLEKKKEYLNWRYCDPRGGVFSIFQAESDEGIYGFIVLRINRHFNDYPVGWIADFLVTPERWDVAQSLMEQALAYFEYHDVNVVRYWVVKDSPYEEVLKNCGFLDIRKNAPQVSVRQRSIGENYNLFMKSDPSKLHIQIGDTEYI